MRPRRILATLGAATVVAALASAPSGYAAPPPVPTTPVAGVTTAQYRDSFVRHAGARLTVDGREFRFSGANIEWLGVENYGPAPSSSIPAGSERYPTKYEVDDALATARDMGATAIRSQTLGDTIGCAQCLEPQLGQFNPAALAQMDMVVAEAHKYGVELFGEFDGDANAAPTPNHASLSGQGHGWYCVWRHRSDCGSGFFTDPALTGDYERHMDALLNHVNTYTGLAYKDDPTFAGWVDGNNIGLGDGVPTPALDAWIRTVSDHFKAVDHNQLFIDNSSVGGIGSIDPGALRIPGVDVFATEYYPHWLPGIMGDRVDGNAPTLHQSAAEAAAAGKAFSPIEFGWDSTDFLTPAALEQFLTGLEADPNIAGDNYWALQSHANGHGWQPIPANTGCTPTCQWGEDGNWWALYYTGIDTPSNTAVDMAARAQLLRAHAYRLAGYPRPPAHQPIPAPTITSTTANTVLFQGSAGSPAYTIQRQAPDGAWHTACDSCVTDSSRAWHDANSDPGCYRVIGHNLDGIEGPASAPAGNCRRER